MGLIVGKNAYMDLNDANTIIENNLLETDEEYTTWSSLSDENKEKLIIRGTRLIDTLPFRGIKYNMREVEALQWPRVINNEKIECPDDIKLGLLKQVLKDYSNKNKQENKLIELGVKSYSINKASISFSDVNTAKTSNGIYNDIFSELLSNWVL